MTADAFVPGSPGSVAELAEAAAACRGCSLYQRATQTVFGAGRDRRPHLMVVGEQPGDVEDEAGAPFVGPAGALLDRALERAAIDRRQVYLTNAVKHFSWEPRGNRRLHKRPTAREVEACHPWLTAEIGVVHPAVIVALGATAARSLLGSPVRIGEVRGRPLDGPDGIPLFVSAHPASILRLREREARHAALDQLAEELRTAAARARV